jgi:hypothetical protein
VDKFEELKDLINKGGKVLSPVPNFLASYSLPPQMQKLAGFKRKTRVYPGVFFAASVHTNTKTVVKKS